MTADIRVHTRVEAREIISEIWDELEAAYHRYVAEVPRLDVEVQEDLKKYLAVRMSGFIEQMCFHGISGSVGEATSGPIQEFVDSWFYRSPNLTPKQFRDLVGRFGEPVKSDFEAFLNDGLRSNSLGSLLLLRNSVAHGKPYNGTMSAIEHYLDLVREIKEWFEQNILADDCSLQRSG